MGCRFSSSPHLENPNNDHHDAPRTNANTTHHPPSQPPVEETTPFLEYTLAELSAATDGFSPENIISIGKSGAVYRGRRRLHDGQQIAVKRFRYSTWPDVQQFREKAIRAGRLRHRRLANLIGYCIDGKERLLVAEFIPNDTLAKHLFNSENTTMEWSMRLRVACYIAEALEYYSNEGQALYFDLNSEKVLFDEAGNPCLSCFGLATNHENARWYNASITYTAPECVNGMVTLENMIFNFGIVLRDLLSGKRIQIDQAIEVVLGKEIPIILDSRLKSEYSNKEANALEELASQCMRYNPNDRPTIKDVIATLAQVQSNVGVSMTPQSFPFPNTQPAMGCRVSSLLHPENPNSSNDDHHDTLRTNVRPPYHPPSQSLVEGTTPFLEYTLAELRTATDGFSFEKIFSIGGGGLPNFVYRGYLNDDQQIVVKRFSYFAWPDVQLFREKAIRAGRLRHRRLANLIGYCCDGNERLLVAEFIPNETLARRLFHFKPKTMEWSMRLRVACYIAEALEYCSNEGQAVYHDLNSYKVLIDKDGNLCLSCFGLVKNISEERSYSTSIAYIPPECVEGRMSNESVIFSFGNVLLDLLSGKQIPPDHALDMMRSDIRNFLDSDLKGHYSIEGAVALVKLASLCLRYRPEDRPTIKHVIASLAQVPLHENMYFIAVAAAAA